MLHLTHVLLLSSITFKALLAADFVDLVTFDKCGSDKTCGWSLENDPVMGGQSHSSWTVDPSSGVAHWVGEVKDVPSLKAPGFCWTKTSNYFLHPVFPDASPFTHLLMRVKSAEPYSAWKVSFAADTINPQFASFKADFSVTTGDWTTVAIPWDNFSNKWSSYTGEPTKTCKDDSSVCPTTKSLRDIKQIGIWAEGKAGMFDIEILWIRAGNSTVQHATI